MEGQNHEKHTRTQNDAGLLRFHPRFWFLSLVILSFVILLGRRIEAILEAISEGRSKGRNPKNGAFNSGSDFGFVVLVTFATAFN